MISNGENVLIVGGGPVGLTLGCLLLQYGIPCRIIEKHAGRQPFSKAFAIHARTVEQLCLIGVDKEIKTQAVSVKDMIIYSHKKAVLNFDFSHLHSGELNAVFSLAQYQLECILEHRFNQLGGRVEYGTTLKDLNQHQDYVDAEILSEQEMHTLPFKFVIGCDGLKSTVRSCLNVDMQGDSYNENFIVADGQLSEDGLHDIDLTKGHTFLSKAGYTMIFPLSDNQHRIALDVPEHLVPEGQLSKAFLYQHLAERGFPTLTFTRLDWLSKANLNARLSEHYYQHRVAMAGDACHIHSPVGGQGVNLGIQDAINLGWRLARIINGKDTLQSLATYEAERRPVAKKVIAQTDKLHRLFTTEKPLLSFFRDNLLAKIASIRTVSHKIANDVAGFSIDYSSSGKKQGQYCQGKRCPDIEMKNGGKSTRLYQLLVHSDDTLVVHSNDLSLLQALRKLPAKQNVIYTTALPVDSTDQYTAYHIKKEWSEMQGLLMVVRPDGYIHQIESLTRVEQVENLLQHSVNTAKPLSVH